MSASDLKCPICGADLHIQREHPKIMVCDFCGYQYQEQPKPEPSISAQVHSYSSDEPKEKSLWVKLLLGGAAFLAGSLICSLIMSAPSQKGRTKSELPAYFSENEDRDESEIKEEAKEEMGPLCKAFVESVFRKNAKLVTKEELESITYIRIVTDKEAEASIIEYGFGDPYGEEPLEINTLRFGLLHWENSDFSHFTGLVKADLSDLYLNGTPLRDLDKLRGLSVYGLEFAEIEEMLPSPEQLMELEVFSPDSLTGVEAFKNLKILSVQSIPVPDFEALASLEHLTSLKIDEKEEEGSLTDYTSLSALTNLTKLQIESGAIRDLGFLEPLKSLEYLSLSNTDVLSLEVLRELPALSVLELKNNRSVQDYGPVGQLTNLTDLTLHKLTSSEDPDLSGLTALEQLNISGFLSLSPLKNMSHLKDLTIHDSNVSDISSLSALSELEHFTCYSMWASSERLRGVDFLDGMTSLTYLDFYGINDEDLWDDYGRGMEIFGDISPAFNHPGLETLILSEGTFEIDFGKLQENPSLKHLEMNRVALEENFYIESYGGFTDIWYDDVSFDENKEFLLHYPGLEVLYLDGNQLTDIQFTASLEHLTHLGIQDNYVTDLSPLRELEELQYLDIRMNPISGEAEVKEYVQILE